MQPDAFSNFTMRALEISQSFEGSDPWANITGNFDGAGLTCGALGWTVKWFNQQRLVKLFVERHGEGLAQAIMPKTWAWYWDLTNIRSESAAISAANTISRGSSRVIEPYRTELRLFWRSPEMRSIQVEFAQKDMGKFAMSQAEKCREFFGLDAPKFHHFAYWFDQAVLNGTGGAPALSEASKVSTDDVFEWMAKETGYVQKDFNRNASLWASMIKIATDDERDLLKLAMIRADKSREEFDTVTMNRRGTLALKKGWINGELRDLRDQLKG
jgi:hypothetical protein